MPGAPTPTRSRAAVIALLGYVLVASGWHGATVRAAEGCPDLQALIDAAAPGATVAVPACEYRDTFTLDRPITLHAEPGAIIDGRDVWTDWNGRTSRDVLPVFDPAEACDSQQAACAHRQAVTMDGIALRLVDGDPGKGEFSVDAGRHVVLGDDPAGRLVEAVVRQTWLTVAASDVTVEGFTMRYASNAAQTGAVRVTAGISRFTLRDCDLGYAAGADVAYGTANDSVVEDCDIHDGGQLGVHLGGDGTNGRNNILRDSRVHDNNTAGFDPTWEAGGLKATRQTGLQLLDNTVDDNAGPGLWCDIACRDIVVTGNRVHHNTYAGIMFEISTGATIRSNLVWENGWGEATWGWGAGILISSSGGADVSGNTVAWNYAGISVISQNRGSYQVPVTNDNVHDNVIMAEYDHWSAFWAEDWSGVLFNPGSNNRGSTNRYWINHAEDSHSRFQWQTGQSTLAAFNATPGDEGGAYLSDSQKTATLTAAGMPLTPESGHPGDSPSRRTVVLWASIGVGLLVLVSLVVLAVWIRRRRRRRIAAVA